MAENENDRTRDDLTEEASPFRIEEFRRKGIVSQSREISSLMAMLAASVALYVYAPQVGSQLAELMRETFRSDWSSRVQLDGTHAFDGILWKSLKIAIVAVLPICAAGFILGILGSFTQIGGIFSTEPLTPDLSKIDPIKGFQRLFSFRQVIEGIRLVFKMAILTAVAYAVLRPILLGAPLQLLSDASAMLGIFGQQGKVLFLSLFGVLAIFAGIDFGMQRWEFSKNIRMTKQEAKQEWKEREGDPQIKARIRSVQREVARRRMMQAVKKADVVVTNPTHIAVALAYEKDKMNAPKVVAKGADFIAQKIKKIAADAGIPMVENVPLARTLYRSVKINQAVPRALYQAVAEVLAYVYRLKNRRL